MPSKTGYSCRLFFVACAVFFLTGCQKTNPAPLLDDAALAATYYQADSAWYLDNIPFFECSDKDIEQVYYYRWKLYKAHIRNTGENQFVITEFINAMGFDRAPYNTINAATMHHIYEGRWLKDDRYMNGEINYMYHQGGNNLQYSESIADAAYARYLVNGDSSFLFRQLDEMMSCYAGWSDHYDKDKHLYFIPAMPDATEYTIASIDQSGGKEGFSGGEAFRPTINSYMYGNAMAISRIAAMKGDAATSKEYAEKAAGLKATVEKNLWNDSLHHFTDRHQASNEFVTYWQFIRGRELAGMAPWYFDLPSDDPKYLAAWKHVMDTSELLGKYGLRTNEPSYQYYFKQYTYNSDGRRGSQWNGPNWPYQTSQVITGMANLLNDYHQDVITAADYVKQLRLFARQHFLPDGSLNLVENYDPNLGGPIVFFYWSNHYNHSTYNNLVISGLCGIRPSAGDTLTVNPLVDPGIRYFTLENVRYHGHRVSVRYDADGSRYHSGKGVTVFVDGRKTGLREHAGKYQVVVGPRVIIPTEKTPPNYALNIARQGTPKPSASFNTADSTLFQAIDGRIWYFPEINNRWSTLGSPWRADWYAVDFGEPREISAVKLYLYTDQQNFAVPESIVIEVQQDGKWVPVKMTSSSQLIGNTVTGLSFERTTTSKIQIKFDHGAKAVGLVELECY